MTTLTAPVDPDFARKLADARQYAAQIGRMPSRNELKKQVHVGSTKANALLAALRSSSVNFGALNGTQGPGLDDMADHAADLSPGHDQPDPTGPEPADSGTGPEPGPTVGPDTPVTQVGPEPTTEPTTEPTEPGRLHRVRSQVWHRARGALQRARTEPGPAPELVDLPDPGPAPTPVLRERPEPVTKVPADASPDPHPVRARRPIRSWPVLLLAMPATVAIWSGWVGLGGLAGFGVVHPLPGIADNITLNTAITLPIGMEAYAAYALHVWLSGRVPDRARRFARWSALVSLVFGFAGQAGYHLMTAEGWTAAPWPVVVAVSGVPVMVLALGATLAHLIAEGQHR